MEERDGEQARVDRAAASGIIPAMTKASSPGASLSIAVIGGGKMGAALESIGGAVEIERSAPYLVQQAAGFIDAAGFCHLGAAASQIDCEAPAERGIVFEQENLAAGGKRSFVRHRSR